MSEQRQRFGHAAMGAFGWRVDGVPLPKKLVIIGFPHTSNLDLLVGLGTAAALDIRIRWLGKHTLFEGPQGALMRLVGGIPVDRRSHHNIVDQIAERFASAERMHLVLAPEGTRQRAPYWRTGFYWMAHEAGVPIGLGYMDYAKRMAGIGKVLDAQRPLDALMPEIADFYDGRLGRHPHLAGPVRVRPDT